MIGPITLEQVRTGIEGQILDEYAADPTVWNRGIPLKKIVNLYMVNGLGDGRYLTDLSESVTRISRGMFRHDVDQACEALGYEVVDFKGE